MRFFFFTSNCFMSFLPKCPYPLCFSAPLTPPRFSFVPLYSMQCTLPSYNQFWISHWYSELSQNHEPKAKLILKLVAVSKNTTPSPPRGRIFLFVELLKTAAWDTSNWIRVFWCCYHQSNMITKLKRKEMIGACYVIKLLWITLKQQRYG